MLDSHSPHKCQLVSTCHQPVSKGESTRGTTGAGINIVGID